MSSRGTQLTDIKLSESVTYVGESAFEGCSNLNSVTLSENTETIEVLLSETGDPWENLWQSDADHR